MADTMSFALLGSLLCSLTLLPVLCAFFLRKHVKEPDVPFYKVIERAYDRLLHVCLRRPGLTVRRLPAALRRVVAARAVHRRGVHAAPRRGRDLGSRDDAVHRSRSRKRRSSARRSATRCSRFPQVTTVANELGRDDDGTDPIGFFNDEYFVGLKPYDDPAWQRRRFAPRPQLIAAIQQKLAAFPGHHLQLHAAGRGRRGRGGDRPEELARGEDLRRRSGDAREQGRTRCGRSSPRCRASATSRSCANWGSRA